MNTSRFRAILIFALAMLPLASPTSAQQQLSTSPAPAAAPAPAPAAVAPSGAAAAAPDVSATSVEGSRSLKSTAVALRELSPWSMFLSADVLVKEVRIGIASPSRARLT